MGLVVLVILAGTLHRFIDLAKGGERVARMVGAREVHLLIRMMRARSSCAT